MNNLPNDWDVKPLGEACKTIKGKKPKNTGPASAERTVPYINIKAFESGQPEEFAALGDYPTCERDDVLIVWDGARAGLTGHGVSGYIGSTLAKVYSDAADSRYLFYFLCSQYDYINSRTKGVGIPHVDPLIFKNIPFPVPSLEQQRCIVAEIEKQFSRLDEAVANLKCVKANLKRYKAAVLKAAVAGKLTEEWRKQHPDVEPASKLLKRILAERRAKWEKTELAKMKAKGKEPKDDKWKEKYQESEAPELVSLSDIPDGWKWARLDAIADIKGGMTKDSKRKAENSESLPYLRVANVQRGYLDLKEMKYIDVPSDNVNDLLLEEGDVLFNEGGDRDKLGRGCLWEGQIDRCVFQNHVFRARLYVKDVAGKLISWFGNTFGQQYFMAKGKQTTNLASINKTMLSAFPVPLPPLAEQRALVSEIESRLTTVEAIEKELDVNLARAERLRQSILAKAFSGQLLTDNAPISVNAAVGT